jgi:hypothetical protein
MQAYREFIGAAPEELGIFVGLKSVPSVDPFPKVYWGRRACAIIGSYAGPGEEAQLVLAPLLKSLPPPIFNWMGDMPFPAMQALFDPFFPKGLQWYWKGDFVRSLPDEAIDTHIAQAAKAPSELCLTHLYPIDGAVHRVPQDATAWNTRDAMWSMVIAGIDNDPAHADALKTWVREYWNAVHRFNLEKCVCQLHVRRRGAGTPAVNVWVELWAAPSGEDEVRPRQPFPRQPEHSTGSRQGRGLSPQATRSARLIARAWRR